MSPKEPAKPTEERISALVHAMIKYVRFPSAPRIAGSVSFNSVAESAIGANVAIRVFT